MAKKKKKSRASRVFGSRRNSSKERNREGAPLPQRSSVRVSSSTQLLRARTSAIKSELYRTASFDRALGRRDALSTNRSRCMATDDADVTRKARDTRLHALRIRLLEARCCPPEGLGLGRLENLFRWAWFVGGTALRASTSTCAPPLLLLARARLGLSRTRAPTYLLLATRRDSRLARGASKLAASWLGATATTSRSDPRCFVFYLRHPTQTSRSQHVQLAGAPFQPNQSRPPRTSVASRYLLKVRRLGKGPLLFLREEREEAK